MITTSFNGGSGNQLFAYAITRTVAEKLGYDWGFNPIPEYDMPHDYQGISPLNFLDIDWGIQHTYKRDETPPFVKYIWYERVEETRYPDGDFYRYFPYQPEIFNIPDNTKLYVANCQNALYYEPIKDKIRNWFRIKQENIERYNAKIKELGLSLDDNTTYIHVRGKDFVDDKRILLPLEYYQNAMDIMKQRNKDMTFVVLTDDVNYGKLLFGDDVPVLQNELGCDYFIFNNAKNIILSNSSFTLFPTWLNEQNPYIIAPRYWWRYNSSRGWLSSDVWTFGYHFLDKDGELYDK